MLGNLFLDMDMLVGTYIGWYKKGWWGLGTFMAGVSPKSCTNIIFFSNISTKLGLLLCSNSSRVINAFFMNDFSILLNFYGALLNRCLFPKVFFSLLTRPYLQNFYSGYHFLPNPKTILLLQIKIFPV